MSELADRDALVNEGLLVRDSRGNYWLMDKGEIFVRELIAKRSTGEIIMICQYFAEKLFGVKRKRRNTA
ncbi:hypothetical protein [Paenibacillus naphthalenovorans]|uniref:hypothetical protein n=1 Tax=Paenibacillus naphthalenovorans TaxID=162209 RepID=UPI003D28DB4A